MTRSLRLASEVELLAIKSRWRQGTYTAPEPTVATAPLFASPSIYPLLQLCRAHALPEPTPEFAFHPTRRWRADYAWPTERLMVEIDGGVWTQGRHTRAEGFIRDQQKRNAAQLMGYRVLCYTPDRLSEAIADLYAIFRPLRPAA